MPIPKRHRKESQKDFIARCMSDTNMKIEFPDVKQRLGVCFAQSKKPTKSLLKEIEDVVLEKPPQ